MKICDISKQIAYVSWIYYKSRVYNSMINIIDVNDLINHVSSIINYLFNNKYEDNPDIDSIDILVSHINKRYDVCNYNDIIVDDIITHINTPVFSYTVESDSISINDIPFDGLTLTGYDIISIINDYIY